MLSLIVEESLGEGDFENDRRNIDDLDFAFDILGAVSGDKVLRASWPTLPC
jgi:hypothetical protein